MMPLRILLRRSHLYAGLEGELYRLYIGLMRIKARRRFDRYLAQDGVRKLQIGAGPTQSPDWLTTDIGVTPSGQAVYLDAARPFPLPDASFDYVFSEHMIEHIPYAAACSMLRECLRILKPGGRIRIATPDLDRLLSLKGPEPSALQMEYLRWITRVMLPGGTPVSPTFVINNQFYNYGHQFLFDEACLRGALSEAGFVDIRRMPVGESDDPHLVRVEQHGANIDNEAINAYETMVLEARRAAD